ncbi:pirin family protein [Mucilaginibacter glaciei]|uniref:Quercetin 2,3-dioxygenase C-terminal cupin domain-containing protein n=1 Tax=Mucilaginibacter glaciei TaxID=2772109 RepID=A0A926NM56_9SPHI|nr:hypothetical protein [Mucilaginibacter glaciei]MBD1391758.1 hypothetical protein [Mucilaginibacter glaciei]
METLSPGQIYLADQRVLEENNIYRRYRSFNQDRAAFGYLFVFNDDLLAAGKSVTLTIEEDCYFVVIPVTGEVLVDGINIDVGEVVVRFARIGQIIELRNPYDTDWINFLYLQIKADHMPEQVNYQFRFDLETSPDKLIDITCSTLPFALQIGMFAGRNEALYQIKENFTLLYAFVIAGAFELQGRLLHERDGLALWGLTEADLEALSNNAVVLLLEMEA